MKINPLVVCFIVLWSASALGERGSVEYVPEAAPAFERDARFGESGSVKWGDYVPNPTQQGDSVRGTKLAGFPSPSDLLLKEPVIPSESLPPDLGIMVESGNGTVTFFNPSSVYDASAIMGVYRPQAGDLSFQFVDRNDPRQPATVSRVTVAVSGNGVAEGALQIEAYDLDANLLGQFPIKGTRSKGIISMPGLVARDEKGREVSKIHRVTIRSTSTSSWFLGKVGTAPPSTDLGVGGFQLAAKSQGVSLLNTFDLPENKVWKQEEKSVLISDLTVAEPREALSDRRLPGKWKIFPYATKEFEGNALMTAPRSEAATVRVPLNAKGWHAVYVGVGMTSSGYRAQPNGLQVKLTRETAFRRVMNGLLLPSPKRDLGEEVFVKAADLTDQSLELRGLPFEPGCLLYVRLVPLLPDEVAACEQMQQDESKRTMIASFDGFSWIWPFLPETEDELRGVFEGFEYSDVKKWWFGVMGADMVIYPTKVGTTPGLDQKDFARWEDGAFAESMQKLFAAGVNPLKVARDEARRRGIEFDVFVRPAGWQGTVPFEEIFSSKFYRENPQWRIKDRDGSSAMFMSYAVPEVRQHIIEVFRETLDIDPDGVGFFFNRGLPLMAHEEAFLKEFSARHQVDARTLPDYDEQVCQVRAEIMTGFMRDIRKMLDEEQKRRGRAKPYRISIMAFSTEEDNRKHGLDVARWVKEGLVDGDIGIAFFAYQTSFATPDVKYYKKITEGTQVGVFPFLVSWKSPGWTEVIDKADAFYKAGADGLGVWDLTTLSTFQGQGEGQLFNLLGRLGSPERVAAFKRSRGPVIKRIEPTRFGENTYNRWMPNTGF